MRTASMIAATLALSFALASPAFAGGGDGADKPKVYDELANANAQVDAALARAKLDNKRVLIQWGANWCGWCVKLHALCASDAEIQKTLLYEYEVVLVDVGRFNKHQELVEKCGASFKDSGIPYLTVLDANGKPLVQQPTGPLEVGDHHDPAKVLAFLKEHAAPPLDAEAVLADAITRADAEGKVVFVHFGAPWCVWCHQLEAWMRTPAAARLIDSRAIEVKIDVDRMKGGKEIEKRFRKADDAGIPWFAFVAPDGTVLATSDVEGDNLGFPYEPAEIDAFGKILDTARFTPKNRDALLESLRAFRAEAEKKKGG